MFKKIAKAIDVAAHAAISPDHGKLGNVESSSASLHNATQKNIRLTSAVQVDEEQETLASFGEVSVNALPSTGDSVQNNPDADAGSRETITTTKQFRPQVRPPMATLHVFHDIPNTYDIFPIRLDRTVLGRARGDVVIQHDPLMSSEHAEILRGFSDNQWTWELRDLSSTNGTFVGIDEVLLSSGDELILGSQPYRFTCHGESASLEHFANGRSTESMPISPEGTMVGRDKADAMSSLLDEFLEAKHALFRLTPDGCWAVKNIKSTNGVWYRIRQVTLQETSIFRLGEQRFEFRY